MMQSKIAVIGATGVYGRHLVPRLVAAGYRVRALVRDPARATYCAAAGADIAAANIFDAASLRAGLAGCDVAINLATSVPSPLKSGGNFDTNDRIRREGVPILLSACSAAGVRRLIQQSIAMVHCGGGDTLADEATTHDVGQETIAGRAIAAAREMETSVRSAPLDWLILRGALFYGPGTGNDDDWFDHARAGKLRLPGEGDDFVSLAHVADMADATVAALSRWPSRQALIISDDMPCRWRDLFAFVAASTGSQPPLPGAQPRFPSFRVDNRRAREALGWAPRYSNFKIGLAR